MLGMAVFYVVFGFMLGMLFGALMKLFNTATCEKYAGDKEEKCQKRLKFIVSLTIAITTPIWCYFAGFRDSQFILIIFYGYFAYREWGDDGRPDKELAFFWTFC